MERALRRTAVDGALAGLVRSVTTGLVGAAAVAL